MYLLPTEANTFYLFILWCKVYAVIYTLCYDIQFMLWYTVFKEMTFYISLITSEWLVSP